MGTGTRSSSSLCHPRILQGCVSSPALPGWEMGRIFALRTPKGVRSREPPEKKAPKGIPVSCGHFCILRVRAQLSTPEMGGQKFLQTSLCLPPGSEKRGCCRRAAGLGWGKLQPRRSPGRFPEPRLTSTGWQHHHSLQTAPDSCLILTGLSQCHQSWGHLWWPGIPAGSKLRAQQIPGALCSPSCWGIQDFSWESPPLFWESRGCQSWEFTELRV